MIFDYTRVLKSGLLEQLKLANYLFGDSRYAASPEEKAKFDTLKNEISDILNLEEIAKIREQNPKDRVKIPKQYELGVERARGKHREQTINPNIQQMKTEYQETKDPLYYPSINFDGDLPDYLSNQKIKQRTQALYHKLNRYLAEINTQLENPQNANDSELKNMHDYLQKSMYELTRFMKSKFYTHRLTKNKDPMRMHRSPDKNTQTDSEKKDPNENDIDSGGDTGEDPYSHMEENEIGANLNELEEQTKQYLEMLDTMEMSSNQFVLTYQKINNQIKRNGFVVGYIWKTFPKQFENNAENQKMFLSKNFGTIWYLTPEAANADMYESDYEEVQTPAKSTASTVLYAPKLLRTAKDMLPANFKEKQKAFQAQIDKGMGKSKLKELRDLSIGDSETWDKLSHYFKGWRPSHIKKLIKRLNWSSVADEDTINDIVNQGSGEKKKRDMYRNPIDMEGSDFFDPATIAVPEGQEDLMDEDYRKVMKEHENFKSTPNPVSQEKEYSYLFIAKIPAESLDIEKMTAQYEKKKSGIFNAIFVSPGEPVYLTGVMSINLSDEDTEYQAKINERKVLASYMPLMATYEIRRISALRQENMKRYAMPKRVGKDGEGNPMFESSNGTFYKFVDGKYFELDHKFLPVKGKDPLTMEQIESIDPENKVKTSESLGPNPVQANPANINNLDSKVVKPVENTANGKKMYVGKNQEVYVEENGTMHPIDAEGKVGPVDNEVEKSASVKQVLDSLEKKYSGGNYPDVNPGNSTHLPEEDELYESENVEPEMEDIFVSDSGPLGGGYTVSAEGKHLGDFGTDEEVAAAIRSWTTLNNYTPNMWYVNDHGNVAPYTLPPEVVQSEVKEAARKLIDIGNGFQVIGFDMDVNGNKVVKFIPPGETRAVSFQDNGTNYLHRLQNSDLNGAFPVEAAEELKNYYKQYMSKNRSSMTDPIKEIRIAEFESEEMSAQTLYNHIENTRELFRKYVESNIKVIADDIKFGTYTPEMAAELWMNAATAGALDYAKEFGGDAAEMFPDNVREMVAKVMSEYYYKAVMGGEFKEVIG
jgi:hypothetical protein